MDAEGLEKLIFSDVHFNMKVKLEKDNERERKRTNQVYHVAQRYARSDNHGDRRFRLASNSTSNEAARITSDA